MQIRVIAGSSTAIYRQIADQIRRAVLTGEIKVGDPLPSVRELAKELVVNPNTVAKAYAELGRDGVIQSQPGRGACVAKRRSVFTKAERLRRLDSALDTAIADAISLDFSADEVTERLQLRMGQLGVNKP